MNSDPYDSAAWRTFGMLDADEYAVFDVAMRDDPLLRGAYLEMDRLSAAIAAATSTPIPPKAGQLDRLQARLGLNPRHRAQFWLAVSGWAAAAALAAVLIMDRSGAARSAAPQAASPPASAVPPETMAQAPPARPGLPAPAPAPQQAVVSPAVAAASESENKAAARVETKRLVQEIEVLRDNLEKFQHRDRVLFEPVPGMALPIIMTMNPPGMTEEESADLAHNDAYSPITAMLGDAMRVMTATRTGSLTADKTVAGDAASETVPDGLPVEHPTAIPIYDAARDAGTLVVNNLPTPAAGEVYNLWVITESGGKPIYVGSLPESSAAGADSFDFSLGSNLVLPSGFMLTRDPQNKPASPTQRNTVLQGPPTPGR